MTSTEHNTRVAEPGERCDCGEGARMVFITEQWGEIPYCGGDHPTRNDWTGGLPPSPERFASDFLALIESVRPEASTR